MVTDQNQNEEKENLENGEAPVKTVATVNKSMSDILKNSKGTLVVFEDKEATEARLRALVEMHKNEIAEIIAIPELNPTQMAQAIKIRAEYRNTRLELQRVSKHNTTTLNDAKKDNQTEIEKFIEIVSPSEEVIDAKIKVEENRKAEERRKAEEAETERKRLINKKITDAGIAFERMILIGTTQEDLDNFDKELEAFEADLDSLDEFAYEGNETIERVKPRRVEILKRVEAAANQIAKDAELQEQEKELAAQREAQEQREKELAERENKFKAQEEAAEKTAARIKQITDLGLVFNGVQYVKDDFNVSVIELTTKNDAEFSKMIETISIEICRRAAAAAKAENNMQSYIGLKDEYLSFTGKELDLNVPIVTDELLAAVKAAIEAGKTEAAQEAQRQEIAEIKEVGYNVIPIMKQLLDEMTKKVTPYKNGGNLNAKASIDSFLEETSNNFAQLKRELHQE